MSERSLENDLEAVKRALGKARDQMRKSADTSRERIALAVEGRNPAGFTEVFAADVVNVARDVREHSVLTRAIASAAVDNLEETREGMRADVTVHQPTAALVELLEKSHA